ncbi:MAG TPA: CPBP family glutamic-type intramembrane protease [Polyangiaceae bacterium]|nr:CPBP family glutamic-type intramembrane protease [Polyangiaceae bacterium]
MKRALVVALVLAVCNALSLRPQTALQPLGWLPLLIGYALLTTYALVRLHKEGVLLQRLSIKSGDLSVGVVLGFTLLGTAWLVKTRLIPADSVREAWTWQIHALLHSLPGPLPQAALLVPVGLMEEIVWRGFIAHDLKEQLGRRRALPLAAALYAASLLPTVFTMSDPQAGPNPLLVLAALGCGVVWTFLALQTERLIAVTVSHLALIYFVSAPLGAWQIL